MPAYRKQLVFTVKDRCRVCYTCVRECPVKAIRILNGQAEVIDQRCIGCGNCVKVCSQNAKVFLDNTGEVFSLLSSDEKVAAIVAPSFPAEFTEADDYKKTVGLIRSLGFDWVAEVGFGADLVANKYDAILKNPDSKPTISSDCPAIVYFLEHYYPKLVEFLAPIVSPMVAMKRIMKKKYGEDIKIVFIGPCVAKKAESNEIDSIITFQELRKMLKMRNLTYENTQPSDFDPPHAGKGAIFPISRGLLQTTNRSEDLTEGNIVVAEGRVNFREAIKEFDTGCISDTHLELLCCEGCIMGPGMSSGGQRYRRRTLVSNYVKEKIKNIDEKEWQAEVAFCDDIDLTQTFKSTDRRLEKPRQHEIDQVLVSMGKFKKEDHLNCGACGYDTCEEHAVAIIQGLAETEMCLPYTIEELHHTIKDLNSSHQELATAQQALKQSEKLANMGQLSAGIAHELNNPLGVITMYSNILKEELGEENELAEDLELIVEQADRCKKIVGGLLNFARKNQVLLSEVDIEEFTRRSLSAILNASNVNVLYKPNLMDKNAMVDIDQWMQVLTNLEKNAVEAMEGIPDAQLTIELSDTKDTILYKIKDNGSGISSENMEKIFTPFFTTKGIGKGTGLGLPLVYGIVKMHRGQINVTSNSDPAKGPTGTIFTISIPRHGLTH